MVFRFRFAHWTRSPSQQPAVAARTRGGWAEPRRQSKTEGQWQEPQQSCNSIRIQVIIAEIFIYARELMAKKEPQPRPTRDQRDNQQNPPPPPPKNQRIIKKEK